MKRRDRGLLGEIERDALDDRVSVTTLLRRCLVLGGRANSESLRDWASKELQGYGSDDEVPQYRRLPAMIAADWVSMRAQMKGQQLSLSDLPDFAREHISHDFRCSMGIAEVERLASNGDDVRLSLPGAGDLIKYMNLDRNDPRQLTRLYWVVSSSALNSVVDQVRTKLTSVVAEMVAVMPDDESVPSREVAEQAVNVVFNGGKRNNIVFVNSQANDGGTSTVTSPSESADSSSFWQRLKKRGWVVALSTIIGGFAGVIGAVAGIGAWFGWFPWK